MNEQLLDVINGAAGRSPLLDALGRLAASDLIYLLGAALLLLGAWEWRRDLRRAVRIALAGMAAAAVALAGGVALAGAALRALAGIVAWWTASLLARAATTKFSQGGTVGSAR